MGKSVKPSAVLRSFYNSSKNLVEVMYALADSEEFKEIHQAANHASNTAFEFSTALVEAFENKIALIKTLENKLKTGITPGDKGRLFPDEQGRLFFDVTVPAKVLMDWLKLVDASSCGKETWLAVNKLLAPHAREAENEVAILNDGARIEMTLEREDFIPLYEAVKSVAEYCDGLNGDAEQKITLWREAEEKRIDEETKAAQRSLDLLFRFQ